MNGEMVAGLIRHILTFGGGILVSKGYLDNDTMMQLVAGIASLIGLGWSAWAKWGGGVPKMAIFLPMLLAGGLGLQACTLLGVDPADSEDARAKAERIVAVTQIGLGFASVVVVKADAFCAEPGHEDVFFCKDPAVLAAAKDGLASASARLAELQDALASGLDDGTRLALMTDALLKAADDVARIVSALNAAPAGKLVAEAYGIE